ncbi:maintenance of telomere capping protein 1 [Dichotomocladium elegans]|nr:maintenance of telomere capping protein 1 [Dichotomocladium elegans]
MVGYGGLEALVYRAFARVMEQTESGHVVVRKVGDKEDEAADKRELNLCEGLREGTKLAKANLDYLIKTHYKVPEAQTQYTPQSGAVPVINCPVYLAIQPVSLADEEDVTQVIYVILLIDPTHQLRFKTFSQAIPQPWLDIPYEENEWVEDKMVDVIRMAVTTIAQDYVYTRMTGAPKEITRVVAEREACQQQKEQ